MTIFEKVEEALNCGDEEARREAVESLFQASGPDVLRLLIRATGDESWRVRKTSVEALLTYTEPAEAIDALIHGLHAEDNAGLRNACVETLIRMGEMAVLALLPHVSSPDEDVRKFVIDILGGIGDERAVPALVGAMGDSNENVRATAAENLGLIGSEAAVASLLDALRRDDLQLQYGALRALFTIGRSVPLDAITPLLQKPLLRKPVYECLGNIRDLAAVEVLVKGLGERSTASRVAAAGSLMKLYHGSGDRGFREALGERIRRNVPAADVEALLQDLDSADLNRRMSVAQILGFLGDGAATLPLLEAAADEPVSAFALDAIVRIGRPARDILVQNFGELPDEQMALACTALGCLGSASAIPSLRLAIDNESPGVRAAAAVALGRLDAIESLSRLTALLADDFPGVQEAAVKSIKDLASVHGREVLEAVASMTRSSGEFIRANVVRVLGAVGLDEGIERVLDAMRDESAAVRQAALEALGRLEFARFRDTFQLALTDESAEVRAIAADLWGRSGDPRAAENLMLMLDHEDLWVRCAALRGLGECGDASRADALRLALAQADGIALITGLEALVTLVGENAAEDLIKALDRDDPEVVRVALQGLERVGSPREQECLGRALCRLLGHEDSDVRLMVARFAGIHRVLETLPALTARHEGEGDQAVREMLGYAIERVGGRDAETRRRVAS
ncbi:MAG: HEAT repeat domain-containing protein [Deltaproteobacteria bacterium]|nr:HEAT repeat domain-containing protein [Deltaproteobacteria bacterium]